MKKNLIIGIGAAIAASALAIGCAPSADDIAESLLRQAEQAALVQSCESIVDQFVAGGRDRQETIDWLESQEHLHCEFDDAAPAQETATEAPTEAPTAVPTASPDSAPTASPTAAPVRETVALSDSMEQADIWVRLSNDDWGGLEASAHTGYDFDANTFTLHLSVREQHDYCVHLHPTIAGKPFGFICAITATHWGVHDVYVTAHGYRAECARQARSTAETTIWACSSS